MGIDRNFPHALYKAMRAAGLRFSFSGDVIFSVADRDKEEAVAVARKCADPGFTLRATPGTAKVLKDAVLQVPGLEDGFSLLRSGAVSLVVNTPTRGKVHGRPGFMLRRTAAEYKVPCLTSLDTAMAVILVPGHLRKGGYPSPVSMAELAWDVGREHSELSEIRQERRDNVGA